MLAVHRRCMCKAAWALELRQQEPECRQPASSRRCPERIGQVEVHRGSHRAADERAEFRLETGAPDLDAQLRSVWAPAWQARTHLGREHGRVRR
jgi:hypothetical protein